MAVPEVRIKCKTPFQFLFNLTGIRGKILGIAVMLVVLLGLWLSWQVRQSALEAMRRQLGGQGLALAQNIARTSLDYIFTDNIYALHRLVNDAMQNNPDIRYIFLLDPRGRVLASTFGAGLPTGLQAANALYKGLYSRIQVLRTEEGLIHDVVVPVFEGRAGVVRLGLSESGLQRAISTLLWRLGMSTVLVALLGVVLAYLLTRLITHPIRDLVQASREVADGTLHRRSHWEWMGDEIGQLARAFNTMVGNLESSHRDLRQKEESRRLLLRKVISAQEEERKRVARELHDQAAQSLTGLLLGLKMLEGANGEDELKTRISGLRQVVNDTLDELYCLALELRPSILDDLGLEIALQQYTEEFSTRYRLRVDFHGGQVSTLSLRPEAEITIYRMVQEALTNVAKHAQATNVSVVLERQESNLLTIIEDDGRGFPVDEVLADPQPKRRLGIFGLMERAELLGGSVTIESRPGEGCAVYIRLPLEEVLARDGQDYPAIG